MTSSFDMRIIILSFGDNVITIIIFHQHHPNAMVIGSSSPICNDYRIIHPWWKALQNHSFFIFMIILIILMIITMIVIITMITMIVMIVVIIISIVILMEELREGIVRPRCLRKHYEHVLTIYYPPIYSTLHCNTAIVQ